MGWCTLNLVGGIRSRRRNNDNKERKKRKKERTKKKYCKGWKEHTQKQNKNKQGRRTHNQLLTLFHSLSTPYNHQKSCSSSLSSRSFLSSSAASSSSAKASPPAMKSQLKKRKSKRERNLFSFD